MKSSADLPRLIADSGRSHRGVVGYANFDCAAWMCRGSAAVQDEEDQAHNTGFGGPQRPSDVHGEAVSDLLDGRSRRSEEVSLAWVCVGENSGLRSRLTV